MTEEQYESLRDDLETLNQSVTKLQNDVAGLKLADSNLRSKDNEIIQAVKEIETRVNLHETALENVNVDEDLLSAVKSLRGS